MRLGCAKERAQVAGARGAQEAVDRAADCFGSRNFFPATKQRQFPDLFLRQIHNGSHSDNHHALSLRVNTRSDDTR
jgi:hypothetical protein